MSRIWALFFVIFINMLGFGVIIPLAPTFKITFHLTSSQYGILGAIFPLVQMISAPFLGRLSDKIGRRPVMITSFFLLSFSYLILAFAKTYPILLLTRIIGGFFSGSFVVAMACAADISDTSNRRKYIGFVGMGFGFGLMLGPAMGGLFAGGDPLHANVFRTAMVALALSLIGTLVIITQLPETIKKRHTVITTIWQEIHGIMKKRQDLINFSLSAILSMVLAGTEVFLSLWISQDFSFSPQQIGLFWAVFAIIMNIGRVVLLKYIHGYQGMVLSFSVITVATLGYFLSTGLILVYIWTFSIALFAGVLITLVNSSISLNADPNQQGLFFGFNNTFGNIGRAVAPAVMGFLIQNFHNDIHIGWIFLTIMCAFGILGSYSIYKKQKMNPSIL